MTASVEGRADPAFAAVRAAFAANLEVGDDLGAGFAVWRDGALAVDLWGGFEDAARTRPWRRTALVNVWSTTKAVAAIVAARLVEAGALDYDAPVARWWPDFAGNGKAEITLGQLLSHHAALPGIETPISLEAFYAHDPYVDAFAAAAPLWAPGTQVVYHAMSYGHLLDAVVRRATGRSVGRILADDLAGPRALSVFIGVPAAEDGRAVETVVGPGLDEERRASADGPIGRLVRNPWIPTDAPNDRAWRAAEIPAGNGHADAASLARLMGGLIDRTAPLLSAEVLAAATVERAAGRDAEGDWPMRYGAGFALNVEGGYGPHPAAFGHTGMGGAFAFADPVEGIAVAYAPNRLLLATDGAPRRERLLEAVYAAL